MDKRSLTFVFILTLSFLAFNHYFFDIKAPPTEKEQQIALKQKIVEKSSLPIKALTSDKEGKNFATWAISLDEGCLTLQNETTLPKTLFAEGLELNLVSKENNLLCYSASKKPKILSTYVGDNKKDLQMIYQLSTKDISTTLAQTDKGTFAFPLSPSSGDALALTDTSEGWAFAGIWSEENGTFKGLNEFKELESTLVLTKDSFPMQRAGEQFYVLENSYAQFVFSNLGGALAEINLTLEGNKSTESVVKPISFDQEIENTSKNNAYFPNFSYTMIDNKGSKVKLEPTFGGYTPLLRRTLIGPSGSISHPVSPMYYALQIQSESGHSDPSPFKVTNLTKDSISFEGSVNGISITKTFSISKDIPYTIDMTLHTPKASSGLWITSGIPEVELISGAFAPKIQYYSVNGKKSSVSDIKLPKTTKSIENAHPIWASNQNGFFALILDPTTESTNGLEAEKIPGEIVPSRITLIDALYNSYPAENFPGYLVSVPYKATPKPLSFNFYAGPLDNGVLAQVDRDLINSTTGASPNFSKAIVIQGWFSFISTPFAKILFLLMQAFYWMTHSWGISIILLTVALKIMLFPLNSWSFKSMAKMQALGPKQKKIQEKFKDDPKRVNMELAMLYKNEKVNPASGCLPMLIQLPFLIGMFDLLKSVFALRGASFIPGWINNLTSPDVLFSWSYPIPFIGTSFHLLPLLMGVLMYVQSKISQKQQAAKEIQLTDQQKQMQNMGTIMAVVFFFLFYNMPSGLNIYFISSTVLGILQQLYTQRKLTAAKDKTKVIKN